MERKMGRASSSLLMEPLTKGSSWMIRLKEKASSSGLMEKCILVHGKEGRCMAKEK